MQRLIQKPGDTVSLNRALHRHGQLLLHQLLRLPSSLKLLLQHDMRRAPAYQYLIINTTVNTLLQLSISTHNY